MGGCQSVCPADFDNEHFEEVFDQAMRADSWGSGSPVQRHNAMKDDQQVSLSPKKGRPAAGPLCGDVSSDSEASSGDASDASVSSVEAKKDNCKHAMPTGSYKLVDVDKDSALPNIACGQPGPDFLRFLSESGAMESLALFSSLLNAASANVDKKDVARLPPHALIRKLHLSWKAQDLWKRIDEKLKRTQPKADIATKALHVMIVGAGPVGLRLAIELQAAGHHVTVVDKRPDFSRINRLHLWEWCKHDLIDLGAKLFDPPGSSFGANPAYLHIGIGELQSMLFKFGLLLGVQFHFGVQYEGAEHGAGAGWYARLRNDDGTSTLARFDVLAGADGPNSAVARLQEVTEPFHHVHAGLKPGSAIGVVANFMGTPPQRIKEFSWARQFKEEMFSDIEAKTGAKLENCVYYRSGLQHYLVMTPSRASLTSKGVFVDPTVEDLTAARNVNKTALRDITTQVAEYFGLRDMKFADQPNDVSIFDFSGHRRTNKPCAFLPNQCSASGKSDGAMVVLVGDALMEPFWPEGLGIVRGFHSVLDATAAINKWNGQDQRAAQDCHMEAFKQLKNLNGATAETILRDFKTFGVEPKTRYR